MSKTPKWMRYPCDMSSLHPMTPARLRRIRWMSRYYYTRAWRITQETL